MVLRRIQRRAARPAYLFGGIAFLVLLSGTASAQDVVPYQVRFDSPENTVIQESLRAMSEAVTLQETRPVVSLVHLERRAGRDKDAFLAYLHSQGYYGATVDVDIDAGTQPVTLTFRIQAGPQYTLKQVEIRNVAPGTPEIADFPAPKELGLTKGQPFQAQPVLDAEQRLLTLLRERGHPFAAAPDRDVIVDHADHSVSVTYKVDPGPKAVFGPVTVTGLDEVRESVARKYVEWKEGASYDQRLVTATQNALYRSGLFSTVRVATVPDGDRSAVPMAIELTERKHRTISAGLLYRTDEGGSLRLHWENRNLHGLGRTLSYDVHLGEIQTSLETKYVLPRWRRDDQTLELSAHAGQWNPDAYTSRRVGTSAWVERQLSKHWRGGTGISLRWDDVDQGDDSEQYHLMSNPWQFTFDTVDDPLDPTLGRRISLRAVPFAGVGGGALLFAKSEVGYSEYFALDDQGDWILAARARLGLALGAGLHDMPPDERFYAGGAASIRGYAYQSVGPLDDDDDPIGGRSVFDTSLELRRKIAKDIGIVAFVDGGSAFDDAYPTFNNLRWGAGLGMRYYTPIGPVGLDVAVPLNKRGFDDSFQVYITLGQAF